jgi:hypothetical protein
MKASRRFDGQLAVVDQRDGRVDHLAEVVRRDARRHADGDALRAVDEQVREARRQDDGLEARAVVVGAPRDGAQRELPSSSPARARSFASV